ncbi:MAG: hypothetical protein R2747_21540 [Pyrinomonadaceae bacterium]
MKRNEIDFTIQEAGCLLYAADSRLGGFPFGRFHEFFGGGRDLPDLVGQGAVMPMSLYQDDGYNVRVLTGDLSEDELSEWTSRVAWKLDLESGRMVVSGVCDEDLEEYMEDFPPAENDGDYELGCLVDVLPGEYAVTVYSYPPNDLGGGWMRIESADFFKMGFGRDSGLEFEKPLDYFNRTRSGEDPPPWIRDGWESADFLDFLIHLEPLSGRSPSPPKVESDGCLAWEYRKPKVCPVGIRL